MRFGSWEYLVEVQRRTNADEKYRELAKDEHDSYTLVLEPEPAKGVERRIVVGFRVDGGEISEIWEGERPTDFTLSGPYGVWVDILVGRLGANAAFVMRKLKIRGNFLKLLKGADSTQRWLEILRTIPTEFEGVYARDNLPGREA
ncbi:MAG: SCP2 sterol-binding domain-containing protein [Armatimonadota bacterium]|nr:SCP2 sterol-binding domain-containing protein [Armatimonadota bacterium]MDR5703027.1 SCP2 sterol-binding domain-containing protein [Armatimonadota bacterium]MDR7434201.1 SCP2 sterol-binding domain-containing protein [Armatimonadota bacterium]